jgi:aspartate/methionine/tyrosine aminotransferase
MSDGSDQSFIQEVAERGKRAYHTLHLYDNTDCVNLYHGDGALPPHAVIRNALREVADKMEVWNDAEKSETSIELKRYRVADLITVPELREAILDDYAKSMPSTFNRNDVMVHTAAGVTHLVAALFNHFRQLNHTVLMFAPAYTSFLSAASTVGGNIHLVRPTSSGQITPQQIEKALDDYPETKAIFLINPNNPTGQYFTKDESEQIAHLAVERNLIMIVDEIFHKLVLDTKNMFISMASIEIEGNHMLDRTITLRSVSKDHGLAAVRSGYAIGPKELMSTLRINWFTFISTFNVDELAQHVTVAALSRTPDEYFRAQQDLLCRHRDIVISSVESINRRVGYEALKTEGPPAGIFHIIDASGLRNQVYNEQILTNDVILFELLLQEGNGGVALFPASCGGYDPNDMKLRLTLSSPENNITLGMERLSDFIQRVSRIK